MNVALSARLPVIETVLQTYDMLAKHFLRSILHYIAVILVILGLTIAGFYYVGEPNVQGDKIPPLDEWLPFVTLALATIIPETVYFVGVLRLGANDRVDRNHLLGLRWWGRETCVLLRSLLTFLILVLVSIPAILVVALIMAAGVTAQDSPPLGFVIAIFLFVGLPMLYVLVRFWLYSCSPAFDEKIGLGQSWRLTRSNGWRLLFVALLLQAPIIVGNLVLDHALDLRGTLAYAVTAGLFAILSIMFAGFGSAIVYRSFVFPAAAEPATNVAAR